MVINSVYYPAYCLDKELLQWGDIDYSWTDLSFANQETVRQIIAQGFSETNGLSKSGWGDTHPSGGKVGNYEANTAKWAVTQLLVWAACKNYIVRNSATDWTWSSTVDTEMETVAKHAYNPNGISLVLCRAERRAAERMQNSELHKCRSSKNCGDPAQMERFRLHCHRDRQQPRAEPL